MNDRPMTLAELAVQRILERAVHHDRPAQHTLVMGGSATERREVLDRIEARLRLECSDPQPHIGRVRQSATTNASRLFHEAADAARLPKGETGGMNGLARIQKTTDKRLFVAIIDDLEYLLACWGPEQALNLRWAMQNVNGLMIVAAADGPLGRSGSHEHSILGMTFATQSLGTAEPEPQGENPEA